MNRSEATSFREAIVIAKSAAGSSAPGYYHDPKDGTPLKAISIATDEAQMDLDIARFRESNPGVGPDQCLLLVNEVADAVQRAEGFLRALVGGNTMWTVTREIVMSMGTAVSIQLGNHPLVHDRGVNPNVFSQMKKAGVPDELQNDYRAVHDYYSAIKHKDKPNHRTLSQQIARPTTGREMSMRYCRAAHDLLDWLIGASLSHPPIPALRVIDCLLRQARF